MQCPQCDATNEDRSAACFRCGLLFSAPSGFTVASIPRDRDAAPTAGDDEASDLPSPDEAAFVERVRRDRARTRLRRAAIAGGVAVIALASLVVAQGVTRSPRSQVAATAPSQHTPMESRTQQDIVAYAERDAPGATFAEARRGGAAAPTAVRSSRARTAPSTKVAVRQTAAMSDRAVVESRLRVPIQAP